MSGQVTQSQTIVPPDQTELFLIPADVTILNPAVDPLGIAASRDVCAFNVTSDQTGE